MEIGVMLLFFTIFYIAIIGATALIVRRIVEEEVKKVIERLAEFLKGNNKGDNE